MTKVNTKIGKEAKLDIFSNLTSFFIGRKIFKYFNEVYNLHFSISLQK